VKKLGKPERAAAGLTLVCALLVGSWRQLPAQAISPRWSVAGGGGFVFRTVQSGSFGANVRVSRIVKVASDVHSEFGVAWHGYLSSDALGWGEDAPCPETGCNTEPRRDGIKLIGPELGITYRRLGAENPIYPVASVGLYQVSADDTTGARFGVNAGIVIPFGRSTVGPGLEIRYFRIFGDARFKSLLTFPLRWSF
jgi:hypothetical protein